MANPTLQITVTPAEKQALQAIASKLETNVSELVKDLIITGIAGNHICDHEVQPETCPFCYFGLLAHIRKASKAYEDQA